MSAMVKALLEVELATITKIVDTPEAPHGYGSDISGAADLDPDMAEVDGFSTLALAQALVRRLDTPRGTLLDDGNYGMGLTEYCNRPTTAAELRELAGRVRGELLKDDRVGSLVVVLSPTPTGSAFDLRLSAVPVDPRLGPFDLTLAVTSASIVIEAIAEAA